MLNRYSQRAMEGALGLELPGLSGVGERRAVLAAQVRKVDVRHAFEQLQVRLVSGVDPATIPLAHTSIDLAHSGGALEHLRPADLERFLAGCFQTLRPGGVASHVFDHRDHLHHADRDWPFLSHLALPGWAYELWSGHPLGYHNRLPPAEVIELFEDAGFEAIEPSGS